MFSNFDICDIVSRILSSKWYYQFVSISRWKRLDVPTPGDEFIYVGRLSHWAVLPRRRGICELASRCRSAAAASHVSLSVPSTKRATSLFFSSPLSSLSPHVDSLCWWLSAIVKLVCFDFFFIKEKKEYQWIYLFHLKETANLNIYDSIFQGA